MFVARHLEGPLDAEDVMMAAPAVPRRLFYAPAPAPGIPMTTAGYVLVSYDEEPEAPWEGQVEYVLDRERSQLGPHGQRDYAEAGMEVGTAVYVPAA